jgi:type VI protein secretion system component Hcp
VAPLRPSVAGTSKELRRGLPMQGLFKVTRYFDKVSPKLFSAASAGIRFDHVWIYFNSIMPDSKHEKHESESILKIQLENVVIAEFSYGYSDTWPTEEMSFAYTSIGWRTNWPDPKTGTLGMLSDAGWNGELNIPFTPAFKDKKVDFSEK